MGRTVNLSSGAPTSAVEGEAPPSVGSCWAYLAALLLA
jgi:hypothetical protein